MKKYLPFKEILKNLTAPLLLYILVAIAFWMFALPILKNSILDEKNNQIKSISEFSESLVEHYYERYKTGELSEQEAKDRVKERLNELRYGNEEKDYIWILSTNGTVLMHPYLKELVGKSIHSGNLGNRAETLQNMIDLAINQKSGFLEYDWEYYGSDETKHKISYMILFDHWSWIIGTGVYINHAEEYIASVSAYANTVFILFGVLILAVTIIISHNNLKNFKNITKMNDELSEAYSNLDITLNSIGDAVISTDINGNVVKMNPIASELTGWKEQDANGRNLTEVFHIINSITGNKAENPVDKVLKEGVTVGLANHTALISKNGNEYQIADSAAPIKGKDNTIKGVVLVFRDVTEEYAMQEALNRNREMLNAASNNLDGIIYVINKDMKFTLSRGKRLNELGLELDEVVGMSLYDFFQTKDENHPGILKHKDCLKGKTISYRDENSGRVFFVTLSPIKDNTGNIDSLVGIASDITELEEYQQKVIESEHKYKLLVENQTDLVVKVDLLGRFEFASQSYCNTFGKTEEELLGKEYLPLVHPDDRKSTDDALKKVFSPPYAVYLEQRAMTAKGWRWFGWEDTAVLNDDKEVISIIGVGRDITEIKNAEKELVKAKERAEESDKLKSAFLANMSHEIRTPMNGIIGFSNLLKEPDLTKEEAKEYISIIENSGQRMLELINDLIDLSKIESGQMDVSFTDVNINKLLTEIYNFFKNEAAEKGLGFNLSKSLPDSEVCINTDKVKLYAILSNLIKNAIKYTNFGSIKFGYRAEDGKIVFFVKDTGIGISKGKLDIIFDRFVQEESNLSQKYEGAGLGLAISKAYTEMLGGKISVKSEKNTGSEFIFSIPFKSAKSIRKHKLTSKSIDEAIEKLKQLNLLIAEDDKHSMILLKKLLSNIVKNLYVAENGLEAIETYRKNKDIDLILMDIKMPVMNGFDAVKQIREFDKDVIIIAQTAYALHGDKDKSIKAGCNDYISKPIKKQSLIELIDKYF